MAEHKILRSYNVPELSLMHNNLHEETNVELTNLDSHYKIPFQIIYKKTEEKFYMNST